MSAAFREHLERHPQSLDLALAGGEDYELLCTVPADRLDAALALGIRTGVPLTVIGTVTERATGLQLRGSDGAVKLLQIRGYEHFGGTSGDAGR